MILHVFNPEHDLALANGTPFFTPPLAARVLRDKWGFLPALWADNGDCVLVGDAEEAEQSYSQLIAEAGVGRTDVRFVTERQLRSITPAGIEPWGWDAYVCRRLMRCGLDAMLMPTAEALARIRQLSHRRNAVELLRRLRLPQTVGESFCVDTQEDVRRLARSFGKSVLKSPWSSSGRGVRFVDGEPSFADMGWTKNLLSHQGGVIVEPYYNKVMDFAMEFTVGADGLVRYLGLSVFNTMGTAYHGSILATETTKTAMVGRYLPGGLLRDVKDALIHLLGAVCHGAYSGVLGVDMMAVDDGNGKCLLHPCVEINLRRTMGHVALALSPADDGVTMSLEATANNNYQLKIHNLCG